VYGAVTWWESMQLCLTAFRHAMLWMSVFVSNWRKSETDGSWDSFECSGFVHYL